MKIGKIAKAVRFSKVVFFGRASVENALKQFLGVGPNEGFIGEKGVKFGRLGVGGKDADAIRQRPSATVDNLDEPPPFPIGAVEFIKQFAGDFPVANPSQEQAARGVQRRVGRQVKREYRRFAEQLVADSTRGHPQSFLDPIEKVLPIPVRGRFSPVVRGGEF